MKTEFENVNDKQEYHGVRSNTLNLSLAQDIIVDPNTIMNQQMDVCVQRTCHKIN